MLILRLREQAERCIVLLGTGLLRSDAGQTLLGRLNGNRVESAEYFAQLRIRLLQIVAWILGEQREAVPRGSELGTATYRQSYAVERVRDTAEVGRDALAWQHVERVLRGLWTGDAEIGVCAWASDLFDPEHTRLLDGLALSSGETEALLTSVEGELVGPFRSQAGADTQLLGHIHEWLLELQLTVINGSLALDNHKGHERRTTGSYFTPSSLVHHLLDTCLEPALDEQIDPTDADSSVRRLLGLRIVDPACGTGVFLIAAARRVARRIESLLQARPAAPDASGSLREVICGCLYGVDMSATAVALCRLALWFECGTPLDAIELLNQHIRCGNSMFGAWPGFESKGLLDDAFEPSPGDDVTYVRALKRRNRFERLHPTTVSHAGELDGEDVSDASGTLANLWCAVFVWPKRAGVELPTQADFERARRDPEATLARWSAPLGELSKRYQFFHWALAFPEVLGTHGSSRAAGFDFVIGNPPWVAHAGRSTQHLPPGLKRFLCATYEAFAGFPTTHGVFVELAARLLGARGRIGLILPASVADLAGYSPTREVHDRTCALLGPLPDYGEGRFTGVTQPCIALVSERRAIAGKSGPHGPTSTWAIERSDLDNEGLELLNRMIECHAFPDDLFGERGFQSTPALREFVRKQAAPEGDYRVPLREGTDVREYQLGQARHYADARLVNRGIRPLDEFKKVALVVRQTARYPIAARSDGLAFRNSLLAVLSHPEWPWSVMLCILNSSLIRWTHYYRFRDGRQPILPQLKVGHLRSLPAPARRSAPEFARLQKAGFDLAARNQGILESERAAIDEWVCSLYGLSSTEQRRVTDWHGNRPR
jgi:hypothetical protein